MSKLSDHRAQITEGLLAGVSQRALALKFGVARSTLQEFISKEGLALRVDGAPDPEEAAVSREELLEAEVRDLRKLVRKQRGSNVHIERIVEEIRAGVQSAEPDFEPLPKVRGQEDEEHVQALLFSDLHGGEVVDPDGVDGMNEYNWDILLKRVEHIHDALGSYRANRPYPISELHIWVLGDMVSGRIHQELAETNEFPIGEITFKVGMLIGKFIEQQIPHYNSVKVECVPGNHGRMTKAPAAKLVFDSFDVLAYRVAEVYLKRYIDEGKLSFHAPNSGQLVTDIAGLKFLLLHGDGIRSSMVGFPGGGVTRRMKELKTQYAAKGIYLDGHALGHFHQAHIMPPNIYINGSVKGVDEWVLKMFGSSDDPEQLLLTFDPRRRRRTDVSSINP